MLIGEPDPENDLTEEDKKGFQQLSFFQLKEIETQKVSDDIKMVVNKIDFEGSLAELENVVRQLDGEIKLDEALILFEKGMKLSQDCETFIKSAEQKIEILKKQSDGTHAAEPFDHMLDNGSGDN